MIEKDHIDGGRGFDFGKTSRDYARYRDIYPEAFYECLLRHGIGTKGQRVLDIGTGTGVLPRNMYRYGAHFVGADIAAHQIEQAKELAAKEKQARDLMKERLALKSEQINIFINRLKPGDHDLLLDKLQRLIDANMKSPRNNVQSWAYSSLANFFDKELPEQRGFTPYEEIKETAAPAPSNLDGQETW